jgi:signal transduction histidine kinase
MIDTRLASWVFRRECPYTKPGPVILPIATACLALATFVIDTITDYEIAAATFYVVVVLLTLGFCRKRGLIAVSGACVVLTILSYALTNDGNFKAGIVNTSISLLAIAATTYLAVKIESARELAQQAQSQLAHIARVTTLGELTSSIAHEVNQPLAGVVTNANACTRWIAAQPPNLAKVALSVSNIVKDANRASEIIARIRMLTKRVEPKKSWIDINSAIQEILSLMNDQLRENRIVLRTDLSNDLPMVFGDRVQLQQVILNLTVNAIDAINAAPLGDRLVRIRSAKPDNCGVWVAVEDSGIGVDPATVDRLFDAFHSTKTEGMGIGLTICRSIAEAHGGHIWAVANRPRGAVFQFLLPGDRGQTS